MTDGPAHGTGDLLLPFEPDILVLRKVQTGNHHRRPGCRGGNGNAAPRAPFFRTLRRGVSQGEDAIDPTAVIVSDWNQCLAPCGPFDPLVSAYPELSKPLDDVFKAYTGNRISLGRACETIRAMLPAPLSTEQMDAYLDDAFETYPGVSGLIDWCRDSGMRFMINTTGFMGYFQRGFARGLIPAVDVLSANGLLRYPAEATDPPVMLELGEIEDKGRNTHAVLQSLRRPPAAIVLLGDSGGDGPHFEWGADHGARLVGCLPKASLLDYCRKRGIAIDMLFGDDRVDPPDFMALVPAIEDFISRGKG
jgi:hypothetical protein